MKVPQHEPWIGQMEYAVIKDCFDNNWITEGPKSEEFMHRMRELTGATYAVLAPNGTLALYLAMRAIGIGPGDEVIVPDLTFIASATAVEMTGATPVLCDVDAHEYHIDLNDAAQLITKKTKAIMPVHLFGNSVDMDSVLEFAAHHNILVVEDSCQAVGVKYNGKHCGTFGSVGAFSFFSDKVVTMGEGGLVVTNDPIIYDRLRYLRNQGRLKRGTFQHQEIGYNFRTTDILTSIGIEQLKKLPEIIKRKTLLQDTYRKELASIIGHVTFPNFIADTLIPFRTCILLNKKYGPATGLMKYLSEHDIEPRAFFYPLHKQPCLQYLKREGQELDDRIFPNAIEASEQGICLPCFPTMTVHQVKYVCDIIKEWLNVQ